MEKLKVGDKVCKSHNRFGTTHYTFSEVERLTNTQAVLKCNVRVKNEPRKQSWNETFSFTEIGNPYGSAWELTTPHLISEHNKQQNDIRIKIWFRDHKFTSEEMETVYNLLVWLGVEV